MIIECEKTYSTAEQTSRLITHHDPTRRQYEAHFVRRDWHDWDPRPLVQSMCEFYCGDSFERTTRARPIRVEERHSRTPWWWKCSTKSQLICSARTFGRSGTYNYIHDWIFLIAKTLNFWRCIRFMQKFGKLHCSDFQQHLSFFTSRSRYE